jgi:hypothetical protein
VEFVEELSGEPDPDIVPGKSPLHAASDAPRTISKNPATRRISSRLDMMNTRAIRHGCILPKTEIYKKNFLHLLYHRLS